MSCSNSISGFFELVNSRLSINFQTVDFNDIRCGDIVSVNAVSSMPNG